MDREHERAQRILERLDAHDRLLARARGQQKDPRLWAPLVVHGVLAVVGLLLLWRAWDALPDGSHELALGAYVVLMAWSGLAQHEQSVLSQRVDALLQVLDRRGLLELDPSEPASPS